MLKQKKLYAFFVIFAAMTGAAAVHAEWTGDGIPLCTADGAQDSPAIILDGTGGAVIVWKDSRPTVNTDIYAQGIAADGTIRWYPIGMPVCTASNSQSAPLVVADGSGGTIMAWQDNRTGGSLDIYAQKLNSWGYIQWPSDGIAVCTGETGLALGSIVQDGSGGAIITWHDRRDFYNGIFAQRISSNGAVQWTVNGVTVCSLAEHQQNPVAAPDGSGGVIIAWEDRRNGGYDIYAQRLGADGTAQWTDGGIPICDSGENQMTPRIVEDGAGGAIIAWSDMRNTMDFDIFAQRVASDGTLQWGSGVPVSAWMYDQKDCRLVHIGSGATIVTWLDGRSGSSTDIYAQKIGADGTPAWTYSGVAVCTSAGEQYNVRIASNALGGAFISWDDEREGSSETDIYAQQIDSLGVAQWTSDGKAICSSSGNQHAGVISEDGAGGIFIAWTDGRDATDKVYAHRVDAAGNIPTATLLYRYSVETEEAGIRLDWTLSEIDRDTEFHVYRAEGAPAGFEPLTDECLEENGLSFSFVDSGCRPASTYYYRVSYVSPDGGGVLFETGPVETPAAAPALRQNSPNPFNPNTVIGYYVPERCRVRLEIFDSRGRRVKVLADGTRDEGTYSVQWNGRRGDGSEAASGVYFYRLKAGKTVLSRKMILLR